MIKEESSLNSEVIEEQIKIEAEIKKNPKSSAKMHPDYVLFSSRVNKMRCQNHKNNRLADHVLSKKTPPKPVEELSESISRVDSSILMEELEEQEE